MINNFKTLIDLINELDLEPVVVRIPSQSTDLDINKVYTNTPECIAYRRIRAIANTPLSKVNLHAAIRCLSEDVETINNCIKNNNLKYPNELKEFIENCCSIFEAWDDVYRPAFVSIKEYRDNVKIEKSIDEMNADELRKYIKQHNI